MIPVKELIKQAIEAMESAYTPYSHFKVGAALHTPEGKIYKGCNIENASYTPTNCAERTAFLKRSAKGRESSTPSVSWAEKTVFLRNTQRPAAYAGR